jgi:prepilin-type processing-associated H-X9-DG protein
MTIEWNQYQRIRQMYLKEQKSMRTIATELKMSRRTIRKYCKGGQLPDVRKTTERVSPLRDQVDVEILNLLEENKTLPKKQRRNARMIWEHLLQEKSLPVAESTVRRYVRELKNKHSEVFIPLEHESAESLQIDWGDMYAYIDGVKQVISVFIAALPHSGAIFAYVYPNKSMISFVDGHVKVFSQLGGVPHQCTYDNLKTAVLKGSGKHAVKQKEFQRLEAHYGFEAVFCNAASGWEKSNAENAVSIVRRIAFTPLPRFEDFEELQRHVTNQCLKYVKTHEIRGKDKSIDELLQDEILELLPLPEVPLDNGSSTQAMVHPDLTILCEGTKYSVPYHLAGKQVTLKLTPFHIEIYHQGKMIYTHQRSYEKQKHQYVLEHYLDILERKPRAIAQALPLTKGIMPQECSEFLRLCREDSAKQQLVQILLLGRNEDKNKLLWALQQSNNTKKPSCQLVAFFLQVHGGEIPDPFLVEHTGLSVYDSLIEGGKGNES